MSLPSLGLKIFADGAHLDDIRALDRNPLVRGFTTNPTLMRQAGVTDYERFAKEVLASITDKPISFEVFADDLETMYAQARKIASWGPNVNVKVPVTNTLGESTGPILERLSREGVILNVTAIFTLEQVAAVLEWLDPATPSIISVFAGRIADTGVDPIPHMAKAVAMLATQPKAELLWASPREVLNIYQADAAGCHIITVTKDLLNKLSFHQKDLTEFSLDTVKMFYRDAAGAGYRIETD
jgi:transaldolase